MSSGDDVAARAGSAARVAIVTGAAGGIGRAIAGELARRGYSLALVDCRREALDQVAGEVRGQGCDCLAVLGDLADLAFAEGVVRETDRRFGRLDLLVNNAAWRELVTMRQVTPESWERTLRVCLTAPAFLSRWSAEIMQRRQSGVIINISSIRAEVPDGLAAAYVAAKGGLEALTRDLATLYGRQGIRAVAISPGAIDTDLSHDYTDNSGRSLTSDLRAASEDMIPLGRWGKAHEIANMVALLASDDASYVTGTTLVVDGGWTHSGTPHALRRRMNPDDFPQ